MVEPIYKILNTVTGKYITNSNGNMYWSDLDSAIAKIEKLSKNNNNASDFVIEQYFLKYLKTLTPGTVIESKRLNHKINQSARLSIAQDIAKKQIKLTKFGLGDLTIQQVKDLISQDAIDKNIQDEVSDIIIDLTELTEQFNLLNKKNKK